MQKAWVSFLLLVAAGCGPSEIDVREASARDLGIVDGSSADSSEVGATVALADNWGQYCGGTLIAPQVVVTAAHCLLWQDGPMLPNELKVYAGERDLRNVGNNDTYTASALIVHPEFTWDGNPQNDANDLGNDRDIGLILLDEPVVGVVPAPLLPAAALDLALVADTTALDILGWGATNQSGTSYPDILRIASTIYQARSAYEIRAGQNNSPDACSGDSGGPAYVNYAGTRYLAGIVSRASLPANDPCGDGSIYTLPVAFEPWIVANAGGLYESPNAVADVDAGYPVIEDPVVEDPVVDVDAGDPNKDPVVEAPVVEDPVTDEPDAGGSIVDDETPTNPADPEPTPSVPAPDDWLCQPDYYSDGLCDCGCGVIDADCPSAAAVHCEYVACEGGITVFGDSTACPGDLAYDPAREDATGSGANGGGNTGGDDASDDDTLTLLPDPPSASDSSDPLASSNSDVEVSVGCAQADAPGAPMPFAALLFALGLAGRHRTRRRGFNAA